VLRRRRGGRRGVSGAHGDLPQCSREAGRHANAAGPDRPGGTPACVDV